MESFLTNELLSREQTILQSGFIIRHGDRGGCQTSVSDVVTLNQESTMTKAYLEITLNIAQENRSNAGAVYAKFKQPFLSDVPGAQSKDLLIRSEDVQVLHGFDTTKNAENYLGSKLFQEDVVSELKPFLVSDPDIRIYEGA